MHSRARSSWMPARSTFWRIASTALIPDWLLLIHFSLKQPPKFVQRKVSHNQKCYSARLGFQYPLPSVFDNPRNIEKIRKLEQISPGSGPLTGFDLIIVGRFWVTSEVSHLELDWDPVVSKYRMPLKCNGLGELASGGLRHVTGLSRDRLTTCV